MKISFNGIDKSPEKYFRKILINIPSNFSLKVVFLQNDDCLLYQAEQEVCLLNIVKAS